MRNYEYFDLYQQERKDFNQLKEVVDDLADRLRERDAEVIRLTKLCIDNNINVEIE